MGHRRLPGRLHHPWGLLVMVVVVVLVLGKGNAQVLVVVPRPAFLLHPSCLSAKGCQHQQDP